MLLSDPLFILGGPRSGTCAILSALKSGLQLESLPPNATCRSANKVGKGYVVYFASLFNFIDSLQQQITRYQTNQQPNAKRVGAFNLAQSFDCHELSNSLRQTLVDFHQSKLPNGPWVQKTGGPSIIQACPELLKIYPKARFLFCSRRGIENVMSRIKKNPQTNFISACHGWTDTYGSWLKIRSQLPPGQVLQIEQETMARYPERVSRQLTDWLNLGDDDESAYQRIYHVLSERDNTQVTQVPQEKYRQIGLSDTGWSKAQQEQFTHICGQTMQNAGFSLGETVHDPDAVVFLPPPTQWYFNYLEKQPTTVSKYCYPDPQKPKTIVFTLDQAERPSFTLKYRSVALKRQNLFSARVSLEDQHQSQQSQQSQSQVSLDITIVNVYSSDERVEHCCDNISEKITDWEVKLQDPLDGIYDITLQVSLMSLPKCKVIVSEPVFQLST